MKENCFKEDNENLPQLNLNSKNWSENEKKLFCNLKTESKF